MAKNYTYDDFLESAKKAGMLAGFSEADLRLAQKNPDAGMSILSYKRDYVNAATDEARALANAGAERIRSTYGGYTGGTDGMGYYLNESEGQRNDYVNQYADEQRALVSGLSASSGAGYDPDAAWQSYRQAYLREGQRAYEDSLGAAAANTGGIASTAAVAAAQQARNYYDAQAADKRAALYQQAYENELAARQQSVAELLAYDQLNQTDAAQRQRQLDNENAAAQRAFENELALGEQQAAAQKQLAALEQQSFENAIEKWKAYGYVTSDIAGVLKLPTGTAYSQQAYNTWYQAFQEASKGVYTGQMLRDTVNRGAGTSAAAAAANDSAGRHSQLSTGSSGNEVRTMQAYLQALGYSCGSAGADGKFGAATAAAVRAFQKNNGLVVDGICGPKTWAKLIASFG